MAEKKYSTLALLDILKEYSDEEHILSVKQLQEHLENRHGLKLDRRTLYSNIAILEQNGYLISKYDDNGKGYFLEERQFDKGEVLLLCNAVHASHFISARQSDKLIKKLLDTQSRYQQKEFKDKVYMPNPRKTLNKQLMYNIETVSEAIRDGKVLSFRYMRYDRSKKLVPRREELYVMEPRYIVYADSRAYMIATSTRHPGYIHFRLDRMADAQILNEKATLSRSSKDAYEYARNKLFMYNGEMKNITLRCKEGVMDQMIDIFGTELPILEQKDDTFLIRITASEQGALYLAQQFMEYVTIEEPEDLRQKFLEHLKEKIREYES
ncbi:MAG: WYL domain-containing protein, partial [Erysipelotrichaceae bacterium]|nr:WYL domain-containing protein [Erysipelotrichaceae bacterium]